MEVRIKDTNGYVDADWTIENGVMIVSPKTKEEFNPKDGDVVVCRGSKATQIFICNEYLGHNRCRCYCAYNTLDDHFIKLLTICIAVDYATEEEKQKLFDKLAEEGWEWNSEKKELVKIKWKPERDDWYYRPILDKGRMVSHQTRWLNGIIDNSYYDKGWCFKTQEECQAFCQKLNESINQVKP